MSVIPFVKQTSAVFRSEDFKRDGEAILIKNHEPQQFEQTLGDSNISYDLRVGEIYRDHRNDSNGRTIGEGQTINLYPGNAVIIQTEEWVEFPTSLMGHILPKVTLLQKGVANTPSKVDPGYKGFLLITTFNHGRKTVKLQRGDKFCSLHLLRVGNGVVPYDKPGKYLTGQPARDRIRMIRDWARDNSPVFAFFGTALGLIVIFKPLWLFLWSHIVSLIR